MEPLNQVDFSMEDVIKSKFRGTTFVKFQRVLTAVLFILVSLPTFAQHEGFVDMGVKSDDGKNLLWAQGDLYTDDNSFVLLSSDQIGERFGWGDITGRAVGSNLSQYGGLNPPTNICGNTKYDVCTAKLGTDYRLPTYKEMQRLIQNCSIKIHEEERKLPQYDSRGVPTWIYGQWMWQGDGSWHSLKFDGALVSIISSANGNMRTTYYGPYSYKSGKIVIPKLLTLTVKDGQLVAENGGYFNQISKQTQEGTTLYAELVSKINGNKLRFALSVGSPVLVSGKLVLDMSNDRSVKTVGYWSGNLETREGRQGAVLMELSENGYKGLRLDERFAHYRVRPVKEYLDTMAVRLEKEKREREVRDSLRRIAEEKEKIRKDSIRRMENIKNSPLLSAFYETGNALEEVRFFDYKGAPSSGDTISYYICATANTQKANKEFWKKVSSLCDKSSYWERKQVWVETPNNKDHDHRINKKSKETNKAGWRYKFSLRCFSQSYHYIGKTDWYSYGDYREILDCDNSGKLWYAAWALLYDEKGYCVPDFNADGELISFLLSWFESQVEANIRSLVCNGRKANSRIIVSPVLEIPKSKYGMKAIPVKKGDYACTMRLGKQDICIPFLTIDKCKPGTPLYKVDIIVR